MAPCIGTIKVHPPEVFTLPFVLNLLGSNARAQVVRQRLRVGHESPGEVLWQCIAADQAPIDVMQTCLFEAWDRVTKMPRTKRLSFLAAEEPIAVHALAHLWNNEELWVEALSARRFDMSSKLCYFALAEKHDDLIVKWLTMERPESPHEWRGILLRSLITGHHMHAHSSADSALDCLFQIEDMQVEERRKAATLLKKGREAPAPAVMYTSLWPPIIEMSNTLANGKFPDTDAKLWDRFVDLYGTRGEMKLMDRDSLQYGRARLQLCHPKFPDASLALEFLKNEFMTKHISEARAHLPRPPRALQSMKTFFAQTVDVCEKTNRLHDADRIREYSVELFETSYHDVAKKWKLEVQKTAQAWQRWSKPASYKLLSFGNKQLKS
ncbi:hypothetical protein LTR17_023391 [Elasticomyces elasticus]|nr:hypothetical protein LTR17_023391 [Elasticomyces elasticus]